MLLLVFQTLLLFSVQLHEVFDEIKEISRSNIVEPLGRLRELLIERRNGIVNMHNRLHKLAVSRIDVLRFSVREADLR